MLDISPILRDVRRRHPAIDVVDAVRAACARDLVPLVQKIDKEGLYPESVMREFGRLGAFAHHLPDGSDSVTLGTAINAMAAAGRILPVDVVLHVVSGRARLVHLRIRQ